MILSLIELCYEESVFLLIFYVLFHVKLNWKSLVIGGFLTIVSWVLFFENSFLLLIGLINVFILLYWNQKQSLKQFMSYFFISFSILVLLNTTVNYWLHIAGMLSAVLCLFLQFLLLCFVLVAWKSFGTYEFSRYNLFFACIMIIFSLLFAYNTSTLQDNYEVGEITKGGWIMGMGGPIFLLVSLTFIYFFNKSKATQAENKLLLQQKNYLEQLLIREEDTRAYRHDMLAKLIQVDYFLNQHSFEEASNFIKEMLNQLDTISKSSYEVGNDIINTMLHYYLAPLYQTTKISVEGFVSNDLSINEMDLCIIFSNLLSNAVEAIESMDHNQRWISIKIEEGSFFWSVTISNATLNTSMLKTSKTDKKNHGFGLKHVKEIVKKYDGKFNYELLQNCFIANITLRK